MLCDIVGFPQSDKWLECVLGLGLGLGLGYGLVLVLVLVWAFASLEVHSLAILVCHLLG